MPIWTLACNTIVDSDLPCITFSQHTNRFCHTTLLKIASQLWGLLKRDNMFLSQIWVWLLCLNSLYKFVTFKWYASVSLLYWQAKHDIRKTIISLFLSIPAMVHGCCAWEKAYRFFKKLHWWCRVVKMNIKLYVENARNVAPTAVIWFWPHVFELCYVTINKDFWGLAHFGLLSV